MRSTSYDLPKRDYIQFGGEYDGSYVFNATGSEEWRRKLPTDDRCWIGGGQRTNPIFWNDIIRSPSFSSQLSNITETGFTYTSQNFNEGFAAIPYHLMPGETFKVKYTRSGTNRGGYLLCDKHGVYITSELINASGSGTTEWSYTANQECWLYWEIGKYDAYASVVISDITITIE